jgi:hypothetical protein
MMGMKPKGLLFVRAGLYRGSKGFLKRAYGRPELERPNRYGTVAKLKAMVRISKSSPPQPPNPGSEDGGRSVADGSREETR